LDPDYHHQLEEEANYAGSAFMFCGPVFGKEAKDTRPQWETITELQKRYRKSLSATLRRYVQFGPDCPMAMLVSTPLWMEKPDDQETRCRHFVPSPLFAARFSHIKADDLLHNVDQWARMRRGGPVADFTMALADDRGERHEFRGEAFFAHHYIETLFTYVGPSNGKGRVFIPGREV
jgi:hypothetical protein